MAAKKQILFTFGLLALSAGGVVCSTQNASAAVEQCEALADPQSEEECACKAALAIHTIAALEEFLDKYGADGDTACTVLALNALTRLGRSDNENHHQPPINPGYSN